MSPERETWTARRKRLSRRVAFDVRLLAPLLAIVLCFLLSATSIVAAERLRPQWRPDVDVAGWIALAGR